MKKQTVAIVGLGYVGLPLALLAVKKGYKVIGIDINPGRLEMIKNKISPITDNQTEKDLKKFPFEATNDFSRVKDSDIAVICVPTPVHENHMPNLEPVESACEKIGLFIRKSQLIILESTVNPGVCENVILPILEGISGLEAGKDFYLAHCPERINPGDKKWNVENIPRVAGSLEKKGLEKVVDFYSSILSAEIKPMGSLKEAEAVKVVENSFRDVNIAFVNELAVSFSHLGIDVVKVIEGAATKPFSFLPHYPGCGVGGHCIPVDPYYLIEYAKAKGFHHDFLSLARRINSRMPLFTAEQAVKGLNEVKMAISASRVAVLGVAYKPEISDYRESPSLEVINHLVDYGAQVSVYDPFVPEKSTAKNLDEAISGAQVVVLVTAHNEFKKINPNYLLRHKVKVLVDGRNFLDKELFIRAGIVYKGIGR